ncbi:MAG: PIN domain-containing protein [Phenylobacterium sp.]|uniref:PIN domain-containing protein n=1 Tax=Phenylobacterium sp. TaxID=1871053 RepID=UPI00391DDA41
MKIALDTNILAYAEGVNDAGRRDVVLDLLRRAPEDTVLIPVQALGELFNVLTRKAGRSKAEARLALLSWRDAYPLIDTSPEVMLAAADLASDHRLGIWDAVMVACASRAGCRLLLSEDMAEGFTWGGVSIADPFRSDRNELLTAFLA